jgi:hypothetical protein
MYLLEYDTLPLAMFDCMPVLLISYISTAAIQIQAFSLS